MKKTGIRILVAMAVISVLALGASLAADAAKEVTLSGKVMCAHCTLKEKDATACQDVLVVTEGGRTVNYYVAKNDVAEKFGHVCKGEKAATVTGTVAQKDGKNWITASKMEEKKG